MTPLLDRRPSERASGGEPAMRERGRTISVSRRFSPSHVPRPPLLASPRRKQVVMSPSVARSSAAGLLLLPYSSKRRSDRLGAVGGAWAGVQEGCVSSGAGEGARQPADAPMIGCSWARYVMAHLGRSVGRHGALAALVSRQPGKGGGAAKGRTSGSTRSGRRERSSARACASVPIRSEVSDGACERAIETSRTHVWLGPLGTANHEPKPMAAWCGRAGGRGADGERQGGGGGAGDGRRAGELRWSAPCAHQSSHNRRTRTYGNEGDDEDEVARHGCCEDEGGAAGRGSRLASAVRDRRSARAPRRPLAAARFLPPNHDPPPSSRTTDRTAHTLGTLAPPHPFGILARVEQSARAASLHRRPSPRRQR